MTPSPLLRCLSGMLLALAGLAGLWGLQQALGAKPVPTHTSTIFYSYQPQGALQASIYQMYEDGTNKTLVNLPAGVEAHPSSRTYGGTRWWITTGLDPVTGFTELFANAADGTPPVQLTSGSDVLASGHPRWSNDGLDRFVTFHFDTLAGNFIGRLWIDAADIAAIELGAPRFTAADIEYVLEKPLGFRDYAWSNQDGFLAYLLSDYDNAGHEVSRTLWVRSLLTLPPTDLPIYTRATAVGTIVSIGEWSRDGSRIAFATQNKSAWGGVWTIKPDGTQLLQVKTNSGTTNYYTGGWSPDSKELLVVTVKYGISSENFSLSRMPAGGGSLTTLTSDLVQSVAKGPVGWTTLSP